MTEQRTLTIRACDQHGDIRQDLTQQAEAERPELWAVHAQGPDELYAAFSREDAEKHAAELNALPMPEGIAVGAVVVPSPWPAVQHWQYLAEQEQDHKNEITGRLRQLERICEGLPQDAIDGGWTVQGIRGYAKRLEDQLKAALARVAELERQEPVATVAKVPGEDWNSLDFHRDLQDMQPGTKLYAAPVAQDQHSVPDVVTVNPEALRQVVRALVGPAHHIRELQVTASLPGSPITELVKQYNAWAAGAPGKEGV
ncbi:hypothetical protein N0427_16135 [Pseudomonas aeruginosa]|nr:hypothetical protein [Pseudomonas aeruginosa]MCS8091578.1 hypothetical protein [Pseudomonas aeruginosa]MCS9003577.1 hypothetical protein [Pseudomonas aeruginosa]HCF4030885.1 hypothetical protein [Pseudomonas aeruginosa]